MLALGLMVVGFLLEAHLLRYRLVFAGGGALSSLFWLLELVWPFAVFQTVWVVVLAAHGRPAAIPGPDIIISLDFLEARYYNLGVAWRSMQPNRSSNGYWSSIQTSSI